MSDRSTNDQVRELLDAHNASQLTMEEFFWKIDPIVRPELERYLYNQTKSGRRELFSVPIHDIVQDTLFTFFRQVRDGFKHNEPMYWLLTVARNRLSDYKRQKGYRMQLAILENIAEPVATSNDPDYLEISALDMSLRRLDPFMEVVIRMWSNKLTHEEIAKAFNISTVTVADNVKRAKAILRKDLGDIRSSTPANKITRSLSLKSRERKTI